MSDPKRAKEFFRLGVQYTETAMLLLDILINNGNSNAGYGNSEEEAQQDMEHNVAKSDMYLFVPAIFACLQSTELYIKGLLLLAGKEYEKIHGVEELIKMLQKTYSESSDVNTAIKAFYENQISIIEKYRKANTLITSKDLYMSLRYPEIRLWINGKPKDISVDYAELICNGDIGIEQFKLLANSLETVKRATVKEYHTQCPL